jgi:RNA recognition motif-containing protein
MINPATIASNNNYNSYQGGDSRPPRDFRPFDPKKPTNLFVGNLQPWMDESYLQQVFSKFGEIKSTKLVRDRVTQAPMGYGFVDFGEHEIAKKVLDTWDELSEIGDGQQTNAKLKLNWGVRGGGYNVRDLDDKITKSSNTQNDD